MSNFKERLKNGDQLLGPFLNLNYPAIIEMAGLAGFDFAIIDNEHGEIPIESAINLVRAAKAAGITSIVRVYENNPELIGKALDMGADGVQIPNVGSKEAAEKAVKAAKFAPFGERGCNRYVRGGKYSAMDRTEFFGKSNERTSVILQVEGQDGVASLPEILKVKGIDVLFVGPYDLSASLGIPGQVEHPKVIAQMEEIMEQAKQVGVAIGYFVDDIETAIKWKKRGVQYISFACDANLLYDAFKKSTTLFQNS
ncbi:aldolase/citrate lyase family protein [Megasphaera paucivorans]|uniref:4-hydroxy-2-oxoheptanedioate aldolase n=1 Tax=Megasphaera paucivorans TaxID=349095 RepID=A0A1H0BIG5_9FIRM|nr:aldolase/citrate lyase family protein [Megasphaera paucivorans]SDN45335.1 4-hydroxy-2-oxoheptanedioate aldolase [Megasphaera paucivorans]